MQLDEFIESTNRLETYYGKDMSTEQLQIMYEELKHLSLERYKKLLSKCLKTCKYIPKIADIIAANNELIGEADNNQEKRNLVPCKKCEGSGIVFYTKFISNGNDKLPYTYVARCDCENAKYVNQKIPSILELGINVSTRENQVKDMHRSLKDIKNTLSRFWKGGNK